MGFFKDIRQAGQDSDAFHNPVAPALTRQQADAQRLMATGLIGQATVEALRETGMTVNDNPQIEFDLLVSLDGREPYPVTHRQVVSRLVLSNFQPRASIPVRIDPADPTRVLIG